jgi:hypothetical protein
MRYYLGTGIMAVPWKDEVNELAVTTVSGANRAVILDSGSAHVQGHYYKNDAPMTLSCTANATASTRADMLLLELKWGAGAGIRAKIIPGIPGALFPSGNGSRSGTPMPILPPSQDYGSIWQIPIAQINVAPSAAVINTADIYDMREFVNSGAAKSSTYVIASDTASPLIRANADKVIPLGSQHAEDIINYGIAQVATTGSYGGLYSGGGTVLLSEGIFNISGSVNMLGSVNLRGLGWGTRLNANIAGGYFNNILVQSANWVTIADMAISGGGTALSRGALPAMPSGETCGIKVHDSFLNTIKNCWIYGCRNVGIWIDTTGDGASCYGHRIEGNYIGGCYESGIWSTGSQGIYTNNQIKGNGSAGITLVGVSGSIGAESNVVSQNQIGFNYGHGIVLEAGAGYTVYRNQIANNILNSNGINANNVYSQVFMHGAGCQNNQVSMNQIYTSAAMASYKPMYGIYIDTTVANNVIMLNECAAAAYTAANNIKCTRAASSNVSPNKVRFNFSGSIAPNGSSYDA